MDITPNLSLVGSKGLSAKPSFVLSYQAAIVRCSAAKHLHGCRQNLRCKTSYRVVDAMIKSSWVACGVESWCWWLEAG